MRRDDVSHRDDGSDGERINVVEVILSLETIADVPRTASGKMVVLEVSITRPDHHYIGSPIVSREIRRKQATLQRTVVAVGDARAVKVELGTTELQGLGAGLSDHDVVQLA